jgi:hypothetical protein
MLLYKKLLLMTFGTTLVLILSFKKVEITVRPGLRRTILTCILEIKGSTLCREIFCSDLWCLWPCLILSEIYRNHNWKYTCIVISLYFQLHNSVTVIPLEILYSKFLKMYFVPLRAKQTQRGRGAIALSILDLGTRREGVISPTSKPL